MTVLSVVGFGAFLFFQKKKNLEALKISDTGSEAEKNEAQTAQTTSTKSGGFLGSIKNQIEKAKGTLNDINANTPPTLLAEEASIAKQIAERAELLRKQIVSTEKQITNYRPQAGVSTANSITQLQLKIKSLESELKKLGYKYNKTNQTVSKI